MFYPPALPMQELALNQTSYSFLQTDRNKILFYGFHLALAALLLLKLIKDIHPQQFKWQAYPTNVNPTGVNHLSLLLGIPNAETLFDLPLKDWLNKVVAALKVSHWEKEMQPYLRYT